MLQKLILMAAWSFLLFVIYATLTSAGARPELTQDEPEWVVFVERFGAYAILGALFFLAYPRHVGLVCLFIIGGAVILELLQLLIPDRDARVIDAIEKMTGGVTGIVVARTLAALTGPWLR